MDFRPGFVPPLQHYPEEEADCCGDAPGRAETRENITQALPSPSAPLFGDVCDAPFNLLIVARRVSALFEHSDTPLEVVEARKLVEF